MMVYTYGAYVQRKNRSLLKELRVFDQFHFEHQKTTTQTRTNDVNLKK